MGVELRRFRAFQIRHHLRTQLVLRHGGRQLLLLVEIVFNGLPEGEILLRQRGVQLLDVGVVHLFQIFLDQHTVTGGLVALHELPESQALPQVLVLQNGVGPHDRGTDIAVAHLLHEGGGGVVGDHVVELHHPAPQIRGVGEVLLHPVFLALGGLGDLHLEVQLHLDFAVVKIVLELQTGGLFILSGAAGDLIPAADEGVHPLDQGVEELVFVGLDGLFPENVEDLGGGDLVPFDLGDQIGVLGEVLQGTHGDIPAEFDGHDLLPFLDELGGIAGQNVEAGQSVLDRVDPGLVDGAQHIALLQFHRGLSVLHQREDRGKRGVRGRGGNLAFLRGGLYGLGAFFGLSGRGVLRCHVLGFCHAISSFLLCKGRAGGHQVIFCRRWRYAMHSFISFLPKRLSM